MAGQANWPGTVITPPPPQRQQAPSPPQIIPLTPPQPNLPTPQAPALERHTNVETVRTQQQVDQGDTGGHNATAEMQLHQQYRQDPRIQNYESILPVYYAAQHAADTPAGDLDIVTAFAKMMDPSTGVREGEAASVADAASPGQRAAGYFSLLQGGGRLTPQVRQQLLAELAQRGIAINSLYNAARRDYQSQATRYGFDPGAITGQHAAQPFRQRMGLDQQQNRGDLTFWDDPAIAPPAGAEDFQRDLSAHLRSGTFTTPQQIIDFANDYVGPDGQHHHFDIRPDQAAAAIASHGRAQVRQPTWAPLQGNPDDPAETAGAYARGASHAVSGNLDHPAAAAYETFSPWGRGGSFRENLWRENQYDAYNREHHFTADLLGNLTGAAALPTSAVNEARTAAAAALTAGATRAEALSAARAAAGRRLAIEGTVYGGIHGAATSDGDLADHVASAALEAAEGGLVGRVMGRFGPAPLRLPRDPLPPLVDPVTGHLNQPLESASPAERVTAAAQHGIDLPLGAATDRGGAIIEKGLDILPASAGLMSDTRRGVSDQVTAAAETAAGRYGNARTMDDAGQALQRGARNWISRFEQVASRVYDAIPISPSVRTTLTNTRAALTEMTSRFQSNPDLAEILSNPQLGRYRDALENGNLSWQDLKDFRSHIGEQIGEARFSDSPTRTQLRGLYGALSEDMRATAQAQGPLALRAFERANNLYRAGQERIDGALVRLLGDDSKRSPEAAAAALQTLSQSGRGSANLAQLAAIRSSLSKGDEWNDAASALIRLGGQPAGAEGRAFNPQTFLNWYSGMTEPARNLLFSGAQRDDLRKALDSFVGVVQRVAGTNTLRNTSQSATGLTAAGTVGAIITAIMNPAIGAKVAAGAALNYGFARAWTNPSFVRLVTRLASMGANASVSGKMPLTGIQGWRNMAQRIVRATPALADAVGDLDHRVFGQQPPPQ